MIDWSLVGPHADTAVGVEEKLSHFLEHKKEIRKIDDSYKPKPAALIPYRHQELSVTRHMELSDDQIWQAGLFVVDQKGSVLHGRADFTASDILQLGLQSIACEPPGYHVNIAGWPSDKSGQMTIAIDLAAVATAFPFSS